MSTLASPAPWDRAMFVIVLGPGEWAPLARKLDGRLSATASRLQVVALDLSGAR